MPAVEKRVSARTGEISYRVKVRVKGYAPATATFKSKTAARNWGEARKAEMNEDKYFPSNKAKKHTVAQLIDRYLENLKLNNSRRHGEVKHLLDWWKTELGHHTLLNFNTEAVLQGQQKLLKRNRWEGRDLQGEPRTLSPSTVNRYVVALHTAIDFGIKPLKWIKENPVSDIDKLEEPKGSVRFLSEEEVPRLLDACKASKNPQLMALVVIGLCTGARKEEIRCMRWADVNADCSRITLPNTKNGEVRSVHLADHAQVLVKKMREERADHAIFLFPSPTHPHRPRDFRSAWRSALTMAKIADFRFHDLRHTCGSYLGMNGANTVEIAEILGHKSLEMARRYIHLTPSHTSGVVNKMTGKMLGHVQL